MVNAYQQYQVNSIMSASPERLLIMLFDGALKFLRLARVSIEKKDIEGANYNLCKVQDIILELKQSLNMEIELSEDLAKLYDFIYNQLMEANIKKDTSLLEPLESMLTDLKETWQEAYKSMLKSK